MCSGSSPSRKAEIAFLPLLVAIHVVLVVAPAMMCGGIEAVTGGPIPWALTMLSTIMVVEIAVQSPARSIMPSGGLESRLVAVLNILQAGLVLGCLQCILVAAVGRPARIGGMCLGGVTLAIGGWLRCAAIAALGRGFTDGFSPAVSRRVLRGPYRFIGHPAEAGLLLLPVGVAIMMDAPAMLATTLPPLAVCAMIRTWAEEVRLPPRACPSGRRGTV